jgi:LuxR family transcriptional regulator, maltose regulon positive regulatory protein
MRPRLAGVLPRARLFGLLDTGCRSPVVWVSGPAGSGKTTLVASWLDAKKIPCLWYHLDEGDSDIATFFYYLGLATRRAAPRYKTPLPLLTMEYLRGVPTSRNGTSKTSAPG